MIIVWSGGCWVSGVYIVFPAGWEFDSSIHDVLCMRELQTSGNVNTCLLKWLTVCDNRNSVPLVEY